jgi:SAM-dependent methyltransferase
VGEYGFDPSWTDEQNRLALIERCYDPATTARLKGLGVGPGWRCLEVGAGNGSITRWLRDQVGPDGRVVAVDIDTRFIENEPGIESRQANILTDDIELDAFDLVFCRLLLHHLRGNQVVALERMKAALRPGGLLVAEEPFLGAMLASPTPAWVATWQALHAAMPHADYGWAVAIASAFQAAGLTDIETSGEADVVRGGTPEAELLRLTIEAVRPRVPAESDIDSGIELLRDPTSFEPGIVWYAAWGRRPE